MINVIYDTDPGIDIAIGLLTNHALTYKLKPEINQLIKQAVIMGGTTFRHSLCGNESSMAEANIHHAPHTAQSIFNGGLPLTMIGLDVTHEVLLDNSLLNKIETKGGKNGKTLFNIIPHYSVTHVSTQINAKKVSQYYFDTVLQ